MFERYTEKARRTIFFARYEASQYGSPFIETEHLLLGLLREEKVNLRKLAGQSMPDAEQRIRAEVHARTVKREQTSTTVDLPLSNESKRVLAYAAEEAELLRDRHIGTEHLLLGLLRETKSMAAEILHQFGFTLEAARTRFQGTEPSPPGPNPVPGPLSASSRLGPEGYVHIRGQAWNAYHVRSKANELSRFAWIEREFQPRDLLIEKATGRVMFYSGQEYETERFDLAPGAWAREHCAICRWELSRAAGPEHERGYTNGQEWLCTFCYPHFVSPPDDPRDDIYT